MMFFICIMFFICFLYIVHSGKTFVKFSSSAWRLLTMGRMHNAWWDLLPDTARGPTVFTYAQTVSTCHLKGSTSPSCTLPNPYAQLFYAYQKAGTTSKKSGFIWINFKHIFSLKNKRIAYNFYNLITVL